MKTSVCLFQLIYFRWIDSLIILLVFIFLICNFALFSLCLAYIRDKWRIFFTNLFYHIWNEFRGNLIFRFLDLIKLIISLFFIFVTFNFTLSCLNHFIILPKLKCLWGFTIVTLSHWEFITNFRFYSNLGIYWTTFYLIDNICIYFWQNIITTFDCLISLRGL